MEIYDFKEYVKLKNPKPGTRFSQNILTDKQGGKKLGGIMVVLPPGEEVVYHYHKERESLLIGISGEATEIIEGKEIPFQANEVLFIPALEKHGMVNRSGKEFRYLEFFTTPPDGQPDRIDVPR